MCTHTPYRWLLRSGATRLGDWLVGQTCLLRFECVGGKLTKFICTLSLLYTPSAWRCKRLPTSREVTSACLKKRRYLGFYSMITQLSSILITCTFAHRYTRMLNCTLNTYSLCVSCIVYETSDLLSTSRVNFKASIAKKSFVFNQ